MLKEAKRLAKLGFSVIWLRKASKTPYENDWAAKKTRDAESLERSYREGDNMGLRLGKWSKIGDKYLYVVDMDIRDEKLLEKAKQQLIFLFETDFSDFPTVISGSGGESRHFYLLADEEMTGTKCWHSEEKVFHSDGKWSWAAEIEFFGTGKQVVLPPSIHPDTGKAYRWLEDYDLTQIPTMDIDVIKAATGGDYETGIDEDKEPLDITIEEIERALAEVQDWADDHETWRNVGMALKHQLGADGWPLFDKWSSKGRGYNKGENRLQYRAFKNERRKTITMRTIMQEVSERAHAIDYDAVMAELNADEIDEEGPAPLSRKEIVEMLGGDEPSVTPKIGLIRGVPTHLLTIPGALGMAVDHYNAMSKQDQPQFAVQTALALGSVVLGRYWKTEFDNFASVYLVILGETGSGKEFTRAFIMKVLGGVRSGCLVGPTNFSSEAAVTAELMSNPRNVTVIDEFGKILGSAKKSGNTNSLDAQTALLSLFGQLDGEFRPKRYSANGKSDKQVVAEKNVRIVRPAMSIVGMSTPETFYDALSQEAVADGFMNRLLIVNTRMPLQLMRQIGWKEAPRPLNKWIKSYILPQELERFLNPFGGDDNDDQAEAAGDETHPLGEHPQDEVPQPTVVEFTDGAKQRLVQINQWIIDERARLKETRVGGLFARSQELTQRIALIVCLSEDKQRIGLSHVNWAWDYVRFYTAETVENALELMGSSPVVRLTKDIAYLVEDRGAKGATKYEIGRAIGDFSKLSSQDIATVVQRLEDFHHVYGIELGGGRGAGRKTVRFFHKDFMPKARGEGEPRRKVSDRERVELD